MNSVLNLMLDDYEIKNAQDETNAIKEVLQELILCGLSRGGFFDEAAFYGGTALRIFYGLNRFSEDLDFSLLSTNEDFDLTKYFPYIEKEAEAYGLNLTITEKIKTKESNITSAFLKADTKEHILFLFPKNNIQGNNNMLGKIKIKFEVDINPPAGASYEFKYKLLPSPHQIRLYDESSLFAGKIHAVLCRNWNTRIKGRDLYDYIFFLSKKVKVNLELVKNKLIESGLDINDDFSIIDLKQLLVNRFKEIDYARAKEDVLPFISDVNSLDLWNEDFFISITDSIE